MLIRKTGEGYLVVPETSEEARALDAVVAGLRRKCTHEESVSIPSDADSATRCPDGFFGRVQR